MQRVARGTTAIALLSVVAFAGGPQSPARAVQVSALVGPDPRPNIVFITTDDMRVEDLWAMPNVQALITDQGTTFTNSYAPFPLCCPARAAWLTGEYNHNNGVMGNLTTDFPEGGYPALDGSSTVATWLEGAGYQTAFVGKYLNGYGSKKPVLVPPGWMDWHASVAGGKYLTTRLRENTGGVLATHVYNGPYQVDLYDSIATGIINSRIPAEAPLFLWVSDFAPHSGDPAESDDPAISTPAVPPRWKDYYAGTALHPDASYNEADVSDKPAYVSALNRLTPAMQAMLKESYEQRLESLRAVDDSVANIIDALHATGELDNTVVVFSDDNGYMMGEHRIHAGKTVPYEPSSRVPLIIRGPGFPAGATRSPWVANIDVAPTFAAIAGTTPNLVVDGTSLLPLASDPTTWPARTMVMEAGPKTLGGVDRYHGVRSGRWIYIEHSTGEVEFYDMQADPYQLTNLAHDPAWDAKQVELHAKLMQMQDCAGAACRATDIVN
jgi:N-acetylglucosamine-6-sulfatase